MKYPFMKLEKKNESITLTGDGDISFSEIAHGIYQYFEIIASQYQVETASVIEEFYSILKENQTKKEKMKGVIHIELPKDNL